MDNSGWDERQKSPSLVKSFESPFLEEELFIQGGTQEWERPVARLEAESPFGRAFELAHGSASDTEMLDPELMEMETGAAQTGVSSVAVQSIKQWSDRANRPASWQGKIYGLVVHTSGSSIPKQAEKDNVSPTKWAIDYYKNSRGCQYINGWGGIEGGDLVQIANESFEAWGVGISNDKEPQKDQRRSIQAGRFEMDLPPVLVKLWRKRWPSHKHSQELLPGTKTANSCYVHVECLPCVYHGQKRGLTIGAPPLQTRPKLRFTKAQHGAVAHLAVDIARRNGWPMSETWWRSPRLLGHEDLTPISRHDKHGGWDPGYLREEPYFDWDYVYSVIESILQGGGSTPTSPSSSIGFGIVDGLGSATRGFLDLMISGKERLAISLAYRQGTTDENKLTSLVFHTRHPELGGRRIRKEEHNLAQEWLRIRDELVQPFLQTSSASEMTPELNEAFEEEIELLEPFLYEWEYDNLLAEPELAYESEENFEDYVDHDHDLADEYKSDLNNSEETAQFMVEEEVAKLPAELVHFAQRVLNAAEAERLQEDGKFGRLTGGALERFRAKYNLGAGQALDSQTELALAQRTLETLAQASMFARLGTRDARTDEALTNFKSTRQLASTSDLDAPTRQALREALGRIGTKSQPGARSSPVSTTPSTYAGGKLWTFPAATLSLRVAVFCPPAALSKDNVEVLVYAHGLLNHCRRPRSIPSGIITESPFKLGDIVARSGQPVVLVVPYLDWSNPAGATVFGKHRRKWHALAKPSHLNALIDEVLIEVGRVQSISRPEIVNLMIAGHSRAYDFLEPLAHLHADPQMKQGNLAKLSQVWAFDTTYAGNLKNWLGWLKENQKLKVTLFYRRNSRTEAIGKNFESSQGSQLRVIDSKESHCAIPGKRLPGLLNPAMSSPSSEMESLWTELQTQSEGWDLEAEEDDLQTGEAEAFYDDYWADTTEFEETLENEWEEEEHHVHDFAVLEQELLDEVDIPTEPELEALAFKNMGSDEECFDEESEEDFEAQMAEEFSTPRKPLLVPVHNPVPFAPLPPMGSYWPVRTTAPEGRVVSYIYAEPKRIVGRPGRRFLANRTAKRAGKPVGRWHAGIDLFARKRDVVVACEAGTLVDFSFFYKAKSGQNTYRLLIKHDGSGVVVNYGEITSDSLQKNGLKVGMRVAAGQPIGFVSDTSMLHFETYTAGTKTSHRWWKDEKTHPLQLMNPTEYLLFLQQHGLPPLGTDSSAVNISPASSSKEFVVTADVLNVRASPSREGKIVGKLRKGEAVSWLMSSNDAQWLKVQKANLTGWCFHQYLTAKSAQRPIPTHGLSKLGAG